TIIAQFASGEHMARKKARSDKQTAAFKTDESKRFLTVFLKKKMVRGEFHISDTLEKAKTREQIKSEKEQTNPQRTSNAFVQLQEQIIERIGVYRSLDDIMSMLHKVNTELQFGFSIAPALSRYAKLVHEDSDRRVFSFDRVDAREIIGAIRKAASG